jgi:hypothetical protein
LQAAFFGSSESKLIAQYIQQDVVGENFDRAFFTIDRQMNGNRFCGSGDHSKPS